LCVLRLFLLCSICLQWFRSKGEKHVGQQRRGRCSAAVISLLCRCFAAALPLLSRCFAAALPLILRCFPAVLLLFSHLPRAQKMELGEELMSRRGSPDFAAEQQMLAAPGEAVAPRKLRGRPWVKGQSGTPRGR